MNQSSFGSYRIRNASNGDALAEAGMKKVLDKEVQAWRTLAEDCVRKIISTGAEFTIEDVVAKMGPPPRHCNSAGALLHALSEQGMIEWTGRVRKSSTPSRHGALIRIWQGKRTGL